MRIVFVASECVPFSKTGGLADVVGALPKALAETSQPVEVILPRYRMTKPGSVLPHLQSLTIPLEGIFKWAETHLGEMAPLAGTATRPAEGSRATDPES